MKPRRRCIVCSFTVHDTHLQLRPTEPSHSIPPLRHVIAIFLRGLAPRQTLLPRRRHVASITGPCCKIREQFCAAESRDCAIYTNRAPHTDYDARMECDVATSDARCPTTASPAGQPCARPGRLPVCQGRVHQDLHDKAKKAELGYTKNGACAPHQWTHSNGVYSRRRT